MLTRPLFGAHVAKYCEHQQKWGRQHPFVIDAHARVGLRDPRNVDAASVWGTHCKMLRTSVGDWGRQHYCVTGAGRGIFKELQYTCD